ncbi:tyrosine-type recombinase/integrase [Nocardioides mesophilus]|uniref:Tyrosine-type recombinase/integrase n=1 Tax=Nocardioides mesophilus TaxID=433659 RepID=A0A7G9RH97_9ACTN|nr:tyrosine-type recombinase/integrase [Nocardioides mesophilus]
MVPESDKESGAAPDPRPRPPAHAASLLLAQGVPARVVMEILGHSQIGVTLNTYTHVDPELNRVATDRMEAALWSEQ